jgi:methionyl-tRNA formyltransferase
MRIALAGTGTLGACLMEPLLRSHHQVVALVQNGRKTKGVRRVINPAFAGVFAGRINPVGMAQRNNIPIIYIDTMSEAELEPLRLTGPDILLVGGFGIIIKEPLLELPRMGCVNCHSSLLPKHRGPNPFTSVILAGEKESGVTFHIVTEEVDAGPIITQSTLTVEDDDTGGTLYHRASHLAGDRVLAMLEQVEKKGLEGKRQKKAGASYDPKLTPEDSFITWGDTAEDIARLVRACAPFQLARFRHKNREILVSKADYDPTPVDAEPGTIVESSPRVVIATGSGTVRLRVAIAPKPVPWVWPVPWGRPKPGDKVE